LGFNVRRYDGKLLIKPSQAAVRRIRQRLAAEVRSLDGSNALAVIRRLNPIIRGWAGYYRSVVSKEVFSAVDHYLWGRLYGWALRAHPNKSRRWVATRYFGLFNSSRDNRWVFGDRDSGIYLRQFAWTKIVRHKMVMGVASVDDPALDWYWASRRRKGYTRFGGSIASALLRQRGLCPACGTLLLHADQGPQSPQEWEQWTQVLTKALRKTAVVHDEALGDDQTTHLMHAHCRQREQRRDSGFQQQ
jgi:RNA-directed DNA polymerase